MRIRFQSRKRAIRPTTAITTITLAFLSNMPNGSQIVCKKAVLSLGDEFSRHPIGTGAFMIKEWGGLARN